MKIIKNKEHIFGGLSLCELEDGVFLVGNTIVDCKNPEWIMRKNSLGYFYKASNPDYKEPFRVTSNEVFGFTLYMGILTGTFFAALAHIQRW